MIGYIDMKANSNGQNAGITLRELIITTLISVFVCVLWTMLHGRDINWDLKNYHLSSVFVWLSPNPENYLAVGQRQSWMNPLGYLPSYAAIMLMPQWLGLTLLGSMSAPALVLIYVLTRMLWNDRGLSGILLACFSTLAGSAGAAFLSEVGTSFLDNPTAALILLSLALSCRWLLMPSAGLRSSLSCAGVMAGLACGLKSTNIGFALALCLSLVMISKQQRIKAGLFFSLGTAAGFLAAGGYWCWHLFALYRSPIFPFMNSFFRSPFYAASNLLDNRFIPPSIGSMFLQPFGWVYYSLHRSAELEFRDARFALVIGLMFILLIVRCRRLLTLSLEWPEDRAKCLLVFFFFFSYCFWGRLSGIERYAVTLELLCPLLLLVLLEALFPKNKISNGIFICLSIGLVGSVKPMDWGRIQDSHPNWFSLNIPAKLKEKNIMYVMIGGAPISYLIPFLASDASFVRVDGNMSLAPDTPLGQIARKKIVEHRGELRSLSLGELNESKKEKLHQFDLMPQMENCDYLTTPSDRMQSCLLKIEPCPKTRILANCQKTVGYP